MTPTARASHPESEPEPPHSRLAPGMVSLEHQLLPDPESVVAAMERQAPIRQFRPLVPRADFYQWVGHLRIGRLPLSSYVSAPAQFRVDHVPAINLVCTFAGQRRVITPYGEVGTVAGEAMLLPTGFREAIGSHSAALVALCPADLQRTASAMRGTPSARGGAAFRDGVFEPLGMRGPRARILQALIAHVDACAAVDPALPEQLGLDDGIHRQVAALLQPNLLKERSADLERLRERSGRDSFAELIDYIRANLDQPLRLSDLEARSFYSRRALQYAFREKFNATPKQWIREQRLASALERLEDGAPGDSIRSIALACGYRHMGLFGADFKQRFGVSPSELRRGRL